MAQDEEQTAFQRASQAVGAAVDSGEGGAAPVTKAALEALLDLAARQHQAIRMLREEMAR